MEREVHRLQKQLQHKQNTINLLSVKNNQLEKELSTAMKEIQTLKNQVSNNFSYYNVPDRQIIQTLQAKLASSAWQIIELRKINMKYEQNIVKLQQQRGSYEHEIRIKNHLLDEVGLNNERALMEQTSINYAFQQWQQTIKQKEQLVVQNLTLKQKIKNFENQLNEKMSFYLNEVLNLSIKIKGINQSQKGRFNQYENGLKQLKKQNEQLRQILKKKNEQLLLFYQQSKMISTSKASDMHTIRNLKAQFKKKGEQFFKVLQKLTQTEQLKKKLIQYNTSCSQSIGEFNKLAKNYQNLKRQIGVYKQKLKHQQQKLKASQLLIEETNKKLYELLVENQACHELLYESRGFSNIFTKEVEEKMQKFINNLQKRRSYGELWLDVTQLIQINQKMRLNQLQYSQNN